MVVVAKIAEHLAVEIADTEFAPGKFFNPVQDRFGNWVVSIDESKHLQQNQFEGIEWAPPEIEEEEFS